MRDNQDSADTPRYGLETMLVVALGGKRSPESRPKVSQSPTSVLQLPTRLTLFSSILAIRGYHEPTSSTYSSTLSGLTLWKTIEWTYLPRARTCEKDRSISLSIWRPSGVP